MKCLVQIKRQFFPKDVPIENTYAILAADFYVGNAQSQWNKIKISTLKGIFKTLSVGKEYIVFGTTKNENNEIVLYADECYEYTDGTISDEDLVLPELIRRKMMKGHKTDVIRKGYDEEHGEADKNKKWARIRNDLLRQARAEVYTELGIKDISEAWIVIDRMVKARFDEKLEKARKENNIREFHPDSNSKS